MCIFWKLNQEPFTHVVLTRSNENQNVIIQPSDKKHIPFPVQCILLSLTADVSHQE